MSTKPKAAKKAGESTKATAAKTAPAGKPATKKAAAKKKATTAGVSARRWPRPQSVKIDPADSAIADALRSRAIELRLGDDTCRQAARIVEWAAKADGKALRHWMVAFKAQQAAASTWAQVVEQVQITPDWTPQQYVAELDQAQAQWESEVVLDGSGNPADIDVVEYIDRLAYWIASRRMPSPWVRRGSSERRKHLGKVRTKALALASLLEEPDGPAWPEAIELFDPAHRPVMVESCSLNEYRARVADRLRGQQVSQLLLKLADRTKQQARMDDRDGRDVPRPSMSGGFNRLLAREIRVWFEHNCRRGSGDDVCALIASLINAYRAASTEVIHEDNVKEWLRAPRTRTLKHE